ncbi:unnamed protein product [Toxocara canis]|nr:unnamed protein product [Toxocara canis]
MPRSKREKEVSLTKVKKKNKESKKNLVKDIRNSVDTYTHMFVFSVENMRATKFIEVRQKFKANSRFFFGKNNVMAVALGRDASTEYANQLHKVSKILKGQCGLMFTNADRGAVVKYFNEFKQPDYARGGQEATETIELPEGPLAQFPFSMEPQLRKLGLPVKLDKGVVTLLSNFTVCNEGDHLSAEQARILKLLGYKMSIFQPFGWSHSTVFYEMLQRRVNHLLQLPLARRCLSITRGALRSSIPSGDVREPKFSESTAYFGRDKVDALGSRIVPPSKFKPDYYTSNSFKNKRLLSVLGSIIVVIVYFAWLREPSDLDEILSTPPHVLSANLERRMLREEIETAKKKGQDTTLLEAQLAYVDVKEAALKTQFAK